MAKKDKNVVHSTSELIERRQKLKHNAIWSGVIVGLVALLLYAIYMVLVVLFDGYGTIQPLEALGDMRHTIPFVGFAIGSTSTVPAFQISTAKVYMARMGIFFGVLVISILLGILTYNLKMKKNQKKANAIQKASLKEVIKEEAGLDSVVIQSTDTTKDQDVFNQLALQGATKKYFITIASDIMSYDVAQIEYSLDERKRSGILMVTELSNPKSSGFIQFRSFGKIPYRVHNGKPIKNYGLAANPKDCPFIVATDLTKEELGSFIEEGMVDELKKLRALCKCGLIVTLNGNTLSILLDDAHIDIFRPLAKKIDNRELETQSRAASAIYESLLAITSSFSFLPTDAPMVEEALGSKSEDSSEQVAHNTAA